MSMLSIGVKPDPTSRGNSVGCGVCLRNAGLEWANAGIVNCSGFLLFAGGAPPPPHPPDLGHD